MEKRRVAQGNPRKEGVPFAAVLHRAVAGKISSRLIFSSPGHAGVILVDVVEGQVVRVEGSWGSGRRELERLLKEWGSGRVIVRPLPSDARRLPPLWSPRGTPEKAAGLGPLRADLALFVDTLRGLPALRTVAVYDEGKGRWYGGYGGEPGVEAEHLLRWMRQHRQEFFWGRTSGGVVVLTRAFCPPHALAITGTSRLNVPYIRQALRTLRRDAS